MPKIAILGGGFAGLSAAYDLSKRGHTVSLFEKAPVLGGLAAGFREPGWQWSLERAYHHLFTSDTDIAGFAADLDFGGLYPNSPITASLYQIDEGLKTIPLASPTDLLRFPLLSLTSKLRAAATLGFLKLSPHLSLYERTTAEQLLKTTMGKQAWEVLWQQLFRKKFGKYAENILASFIWSRIKKRSTDLVYIRGGFQSFIDHIENQLIELGVDLRLGEGVDTITRKNQQFIINKQKYDRVISTLPSKILINVGGELFPSSYLKSLSRLNYLHATNLIIETDRPIIGKTYWLNVIAKEIPIMVLVQHTNLADKKYYGNKHLLYIGNYVDADSNLLKMDGKEALKFFLPYLKKISNFKFQISNYYYFKGPFAQPIFDKTFLKNKPDFLTPVKNFYIANLDMTYPHDRGTNYAVKLGREVAQLINK